VAAKDLRVGQRGLDSEGNDVVYVSVEIREEQAKHYNFEVEDFHTYFVSEREGDPTVWVHNACKVTKSAREFRVSGSRRNEFLKNATHQDVEKAFKGSGLKVSNHFVKRIKDTRLWSSGVRTFRDVETILKKGVRTIDGGELAFTHRGVKIIVDPSTGRLVTIRHAKK
tara:strand:+ start:220 stop:723 length:504 start_codon:yes stop_codon:yes gene_type:complete